MNAAYIPKPQPNAYIKGWLGETISGRPHLMSVGFYLQPIAQRDGDVEDINSRISSTTNHQVQD
jgi:hypothetical protein